MNTSRCLLASRAFTRTELAVTICVLLFVVAGLMQVKAVRMREAQARLLCIDNLRRIGVASKSWSSPHGWKFPQQVSVADGGTREHLLRGEVFRHYQSLAKELGSPSVLGCPSDSRRAPLDFTGAWSNQNIGYFAAVDIETVYVQVLLAGDRNLTNSVPPSGGLLTISRHDLPGWDGARHGGFGIVVLADGSVHQMDTPQLHARISGVSLPPTNRIVLPLP